MEPGERPRLNADGHLYYVRHKPAWSGGGGFWPDGVGYESQAEAMAAAEEQVPSTVNCEWVPFPEPARAPSAASAGVASSRP